LGPAVRVAVRVEGTVQGVGFRPFVRNLASELGLSGLVGNDSEGVFIEVEGKSSDIDVFLGRLESAAPPLSVIDGVQLRPLPPLGEAGFRIVTSAKVSERNALVAADTATCEDCLGELFDPSDRRYRYPFINCTNCGPRFTIVRDVPYDRPNTTMAGFPMCPACRAEYESPSDRRFHAQPTCCPNCGPHLTSLLPGGEVVAERSAALERSTAALRAENVVAIKGLGGYHLAVLAASENAAASLRARKHREDKPFAVMVKDLHAAGELCDLAAPERELLASAAHPIVLARRSEAGGDRVAPSVAPGNRYLGVMLPYTPLHHLLAEDLGEPFVLTSGNRSDEPIAYQDADALARLGGVADLFLVHDRPVHMRTDDSVTRSLRGQPAVLRRSRGYVPQPVRLRERFPRPVLACGAELKNTFCLAKSNRAFISHHIGDLENYETLRSFREGISHFEKLFAIQPAVVAHDLHPEYLSTKYALERARLEAVELVGVQHHHAHVASCLADNKQTGPAIGVAFDGLGFGDDGTLWGGEILVADLASYQRLGHLANVPMPGGAGAIKHPWRMAVPYLAAAFPGGPPGWLEVFQRHEEDWNEVAALARTGTASPATSSMGRLFDAVGAIVLGRDSVNYEGQAAVELEQAAGPEVRSCYEVNLEGAGEFTVSGASIVRAVVEDVRAGVPKGVVAGRFHNTVGRIVLLSCLRAREMSDGLSTVALSGGVFQNVLLTERAADLLEAEGFRVLLHSRVPPNDGGISLGQAAIAGALDRRVPT